MPDRIQIPYLINKNIEFNFYMDFSSKFIHPKSYHHSLFENGVFLPFLP